MQDKAAYFMVTEHEEDRGQEGVGGIQFALLTSKR